MIKKIIFPLAITLSLTTHHAIGMDTGDDKSTILAKLAVLKEEHAKEMKKNNTLKMEQRKEAESSMEYKDATLRPVAFYSVANREFSSAVEYVDVSLKAEPGKHDELIQSNNRLSEIWVERQKLEALLKKAE
jgi:C1A family cysteine protease